MIARSIVVFLTAALVGVQIVRNAAVARLAAAKPAQAEQVWSGHPATELSSAMTMIAQAAHDRRPVPASVFALMRDAAAKEPLAPEPFLVGGVQAQLEGQEKVAQRGFEEAQWRDPRSLPAAYFLADRYFRAGDSQRSLREVAALARLAPNGATAVAPYLAAYARSPANWPALRAVFRANPSLAEVALAKLASNVATVPAVLALADPKERADRAEWLAPLLNTLTGVGDYARARAIWGKATGVSGGDLIHDSSFSDKRAPPPFNWTLTSSAVGLAERQRGGRLHVLFYGQEDGILASQLLLLPAGSYQLTMRLLGDPAQAKSLSWSIWCGDSGTPVAAMTLDVVAARGWRFQVPANCPGQWLKLSGSSRDIPQQVDVTIGSLSLQKVDAGA